MQTTIVESTPAVIKTSKPLRRKIHERIQEAGFESQNQQLVELGFTRLGQNLKLLKLHEGKVESVLAKLQEKAAKRQAKLASKSAQEGENNNKTEKERKPRKERVAVKGLKKCAELPSEVHNLYLDGTTMLRASNYVRRLTGNPEKKLSEKNLTDLALKFAQSLGTVNVTVIFDDITETSTQEIGNMKFSVMSAKPEFANSGDALVAWAKKIPEGKSNESLFVTAKREAHVKLNESGIENILRSRKFLDLVKNTIDQEKFIEILA